MELKAFEYELPVHLIFGAGKAECIGKEVKKYGKKVLIVTGRGSTKRSGLLDRVEKLLEAEGLEHLLFDEVEPNPLASTAEKGAQIARENGCEAVLGLGGGSIMDCSKSIAFAALNEGKIFDYIYQYGIPKSINDGYYSLFYLSQIISELIYKVRVIKKS